MFSFENLDFYFPNSVLNIAATTEKHNLYLLLISFSSIPPFFLFMLQTYRPVFGWYVTSDVTSVIFFEKQVKTGTPEKIRSNQ
jgi:hypothetical protein